MSSTQTKNKMDKKKRKVFGDEEIENLLEIWASDKIQKQFYSTTRHNLIYESISRQLKELGFTCTSTEVKSKILNLKTEYRSKKPKSGGSTPDWKYFAIIHKVLGQRDAANDDLMDESLAASDDNVDDADLLSHPGDSVASEDVEATKETPSPSDEPQSCKGLPLAVPRIPNEPRIRKISRPPRRTHSREDKLIDTLIKTEDAFQKRLDTMVELEKRHEKRDDLVATSMTRFLNAFAVLAENSAKNVTASFPLDVPLTNIHENTSRRSVVEKRKRSSIVKNEIETPSVTALSSEQQWKNHCRKSTSTSSMASSVLESQDSDQYAVSDIEKNYIVEYLDAIDSPPHEASNEYELEHFESFIEHIDDDIDNLPKFCEAKGVEEKETGIDPVFEFIKSEMNSTMSKKYNNSKKPRIISDEHLQQPFHIKKNVGYAGPNIFGAPSVPTATSSTYNSSKQRYKSDSIIISKGNC